MYDGKRPSDFGEAKWICEEPYAWFDVTDSSNDELEGEITIDNNTYVFLLWFVPETNTVLCSVIDVKTESGEYTYNGATNTKEYDYIGGFDGNCVFSSDELIIKVNSSTDTITDDKYKDWVFKRTLIQ